MGGSYVDGVLQCLCGCMPARLSLAAMAFLGFVMMTSVRVNLSVALVAMVRHNASNAAKAQIECQGNESVTMLRQEGAGNRTLVTPWEDGDEMRGQEEEEGFDWDEMTQGLVLAGFFYGYIFTQIIGGRLAEVYGTRLTFGLCGVTSGFFTLLSPIAARTHYGAFIAVRVLMGFFQGPMWPSMHALVPRWIPPLERARFISVVYLASSLSMMLTMAFTGVVIDFFGWEAAFYIPGTICLLWALCWFVLVADSPSQHPRISLKEKQYIESCVRKSGTSSKRPKKIPWCAILSCIPFWAIVVIDAGNVFGLSIFFTHLPTYMKNVLGFSIKENGFLSSLPFLFRYIGGLCFSTLGDWLLSSGRISVITCRRVSSVAAMIVPALLCIATAYSGCSATLAITFLCIVTFNNGAVVNTSMVNLVDIAPNFSGTIYGLSNTVEAITMFLSPICVAAIIQGQQTLAQWRKVFWMAVPLYILPEIFYLFFCSTSVQPWNSTGEEEEVAEGEISPLSQEEVKKDVKV